MKFEEKDKQFIIQNQIQLMKFINMRVDELKEGAVSFPTEEERDMARLLVLECRNWLTYIKKISDISKKIEQSDL